MGRRAVIQNEELLYEVIETGEEFFVPCRDKTDAHSKSVSLNNARGRMAADQQRQIKVQKLQIGEVWGVKISPASKTVVYKLVDGIMTPWKPTDSRLSEDAYRLVELMVKDGKSDEEILAILNDENEDFVTKAIKLVRE